MAGLDVLLRAIGTLLVGVSLPVGFFLTDRGRPSLGLAVGLSLYLSGVALSLAGGLHA